MRAIHSLLAPQTRGLTDGGTSGSPSELASSSTPDAAPASAGTAAFSGVTSLSRML